MKRTIAVLLAAALVGLSFAGCSKSGDYAENLEKTGYFSNKTADSIPQTAVQDIVFQHFNTPLAQGKTVKKALVLFLDGCRSDMIPVIAPYGKGIMKAAKDGGLYFAYAGGTTKSFRTDTAPGFFAMLTGNWADKYGITDNTKAKEVEPLTCMTKLAQTKGRSVSFLVEWGTHIDVQYKAELEWAKQQSLDLTAEKAEDAQELQSKILQSIDSKDATFGLYAEPDGAGHGTGFDPKNAAYVAAAVNTNSYVDEAIEHVYDRPSYNTEDWLILVSTDHGGHGKNHYQASPTERLTWIAVNQKIDGTKYKEDGFKL